MIRRARDQDIDQIVDLVELFLKETAYSNRELGQDREHISRIVWTCLRQGYIWLGFSQGQAVGLLIATREPILWQPKIHCLRELIWYVHPSARSSSIGGRLFVEYQRTADDLRARQEIEGYFTTRMSSTAPIDYERRGFRLTEMTYLKE